MHTHRVAIRARVGRAMAFSRLPREKPLQLITVSSLLRSMLARAMMLPSSPITGARLTNWCGSMEMV